MMSEKVATFNKQNGICRRYLFYDEDYVSSFRALAYLIDKQSGKCRRYLLLQGLCAPSVKITTYVCNRFNTSFCTKTTKHTRLYSATHYCTRLQRAKERLYSDYIIFSLKKLKILWGPGAGTQISLKNN